MHWTGKCSAVTIWPVHVPSWLFTPAPPCAWSMVLRSALGWNVQMLAYWARFPHSEHQLCFAVAQGFFQCMHTVSYEIPSILVTFQEVYLWLLRCTYLFLVVTCPLILLDLQVKVGGTLLSNSWGGSASHTKFTHWTWNPYFNPVGTTTLFHWWVWSYISDKTCLESVEMEKVLRKQDTVCIGPDEGLLGDSFARLPFSGQLLH